MDCSNRSKATCRYKKLKPKTCCYDQEDNLIKETEVRKTFEYIIRKLDKAADKFDNMPGDDVYRIIRAYIVDESNKFYYKLQKGANK